MKSNLVKKMMVGVMAGVMMLSSMSVGASAASYKDGTYTASVNFYVPQAQAPQHLFNAYLNDTEIPPKNAATQNVKVDISSGVITLDLPITNTQFGIEALGDELTQHVVATLQGEGKVVCDNHSGIRYNNLHAVIKSGNTGAETLSYTFDESDFHARITKTILGSIEITAYDKEFSANPVLQVVLPSDAIVQ